jgi:hypothetical protein
MGVKTRLAILELSLKHERELADIKAESLKLALGVAREVEAVHFESLNNANARFDTQARTFLPAATYQKSEDQHTIWRIGVDRAMSRIQTIGMLAIVAIPIILFFASRFWK